MQNSNFYDIISLVLKYIIDYLLTYMDI